MGYSLIEMKTAAGHYGAVSNKLSGSADLRFLGYLERFGVETRTSSFSMLVFQRPRFRNILQLLQVGTAACRLLVRDQVVQRDEVNRNTEESASNSIFPRDRELDTGNLRENVYPNRCYADLVSQLASCECFRSDLFGFERSASFFLLDASLIFVCLNHIFLPFDFGNSSMRNFGLRDTGQLALLLPQRLLARPGLCAWAAGFRMRCRIDPSVIEHVARQGGISVQNFFRGDAPFNHLRN